MNQPLAFELNLDLPYAAAVERVTDALKTEGFGVLTQIDVRATLKEKLGEEFRPLVILGACNPPLAHKALSHRSEVGLMLPCNVIVEGRSETSSLVRIGNPDAFMTIGSFGEDPTLQEVAGEARSRLERVAANLAGAGSVTR